MKLRVIAAIALVLSAGAVLAEPQAPTPLKCETGPAHRQFGGTDWLVYSCEDGRSMVVVSSSGNPASPFYFVLTPLDGSYKIYGEGNGSKPASDAAGDDLARLQPDDFTKMLEETKSKPAAPN